MPLRTSLNVLHHFYLFKTAPPTVSNDETQGIIAGMRWLDLTSSPKLEYVCLDATEGAAVWECTSSADTALSVVTLTDGATITPDASDGSIFDVTIFANRTMAAPLLPVNGKRILFRIKQGDDTPGHLGAHLITWNAIYRFSTSVPSPTLSTAVGSMDMVAFMYNAAAVKWDAIGTNLGFT